MNSFQDIQWQRSEWFTKNKGKIFEEQRTKEGISPEPGSLNYDVLHIDSSSVWQLVTPVPQTSASGQNAIEYLCPCQQHCRAESLVFFTSGFKMALLFPDLL